MSTLLALIPVGIAALLFVAVVRIERRNQKKKPNHWGDL
jgi:hypothetical protein